MIGPSPSTKHSRPIDGNSEETRANDAAKSPEQDGGQRRCARITTVDIADFLEW